MNNDLQSTRRRHRLHRLSLAIALAGASLPALAGDVQIDGYLREELSWNAADWADTPGYDDQGKLSMARTTARVNIDWQMTDNVALVAKLRATREYKSGFLEHLEDMGANSYDGGDIMDLYNDEEIRELYVDFPVGDRLSFRLGKQQIVWGETDFFNANDMVHGYDNTWRSFLEPANEELRKGNIIAKMNIDFPEVDGGVEMFIRPGWDDESDIGTEVDIYGGRWSSMPYAGVDFREIDPYNFDNSEGDYNKPTYGIRWNGMWGDANYSVSYLKTFYTSPMLNAANNLALFGLPDVSSGIDTVGADSTKGIAGEIIYPIVDVFGFTASTYSEWADAVFSTEMAYIKDAPYQRYIPGPISQAVSPGFDGIDYKDVIALMVRMDKNIAATQRWLGTEKPMFFSLQLFDKWIQNYDEDDALLYGVGWGGQAKEHSVLATTIFDMSYNNGRVKPQLVLGADLTNGGGMAIPSVSVELSRNLRWKVEYDAFWDSGARSNDACVYPNAASCDSTTLFGYLHNRDQLYTSLTYLF